MMTDPQYPQAAARHGRPAPPVTATERRQANAKPARNILAIVGLLLGVAALVVTFVPDIEFVAWPLGGIGLVLAVTGLVQAKKGTVGDRPVAITATGVTAAALLTAAGIDTSVELPEPDLLMDARLRAELRRATAAALHDDTARTCVIRVTRAAVDVRIEAR